MFYENSRAVRIRRNTSRHCPRISTSRQIKRAMGAVDEMARISQIKAVVHLWGYEWMSLARSATDRSRRGSN